MAICSSRMGAYWRGGLFQGGGQFEDLRYVPNHTTHVKMFLSTLLTDLFFGVTSTVVEIQAFIWGAQTYDFPTRKHLLSCLILKKLHILMKIGDFWRDPLEIFADFAILK